MIISSMILYDCLHSRLRLQVVCELTQYSRRTSWLRWCSGGKLTYKVRCRFGMIWVLSGYFNMATLEIPHVHQAKSSWVPKRNHLSIPWNQPKKAYVSTNRCLRIIQTRQHDMFPRFPNHWIVEIWKGFHGWSCLEESLRGRAEMRWVKYDKEKSRLSITGT